jgi:hypothetical protein
MEVINVHVYFFFFPKVDIVIEEEFEDTEGVIRIRT